VKPRPKLRLSALPGADIVPLHVPGQRRICNPSIATSDRGFLCIVRAVNYELTEKAALRYVAEPYDRPETHNWLLDLDADLQIVNARRIEEGGVLDFLHLPAGSDIRSPDEAGVSNSPITVNDIEDCRLFRWNDAWWFTATFVFQIMPAKAQMALGRLDAATVAEFHLLPSPLKADVEKNWMVRAKSDRLEWIYWIDPTAVLDYVGGKLSYKLLGRHGSLENWFGSSQLVPYRGNWLSVIHKTRTSSKGKTYEHRFVEWTDEFVIRRVSPRFSFEGQKIEFCAGLCLTDRHAILSYGLWDRQAHLMRLDIATVEAMLRPPRMPAVLAIVLADLRRKARPWIRHRWVRQPGKQIRAIKARWREKLGR